MDTNTIALSVPALAAVITALFIWWVKRTLEKADVERATKDEVVAKAIKELKDESIKVRIQLEKRVTYEHFEAQMEKLRDEIREMIKDFKGDVSTLIKGLVK